MIDTSFLLFVQLSGGLLVIGSVCGTIWFYCTKITRKQLLTVYTVVAALMIIMKFITFFMSLPLSNKLNTNTWPMNSTYVTLKNGITVTVDKCCSGDIQEQNKKVCDYFPDICTTLNRREYVTGKLNKFTVPLDVFLILGVILEVFVIIPLYFIRFDETLFSGTYVSTDELMKIKKKVPV